MSLIITKRYVAIPYINLDRLDDIYIAYLIRLKSAKFYDINHVHNHTRQDLIDTLAFYKSFATIVCKALVI